MHHVTAMVEPGYDESSALARRRYMQLCRVFSEPRVQLRLRGRFAELRWPADDAFAAITTLFTMSSTAAERNSLYALMPMVSKSNTDGAGSSLAAAQIGLFKEFAARLQANPDIAEANALIALQDRLAEFVGSVGHAVRAEVLKIRIRPPDVAARPDGIGIFNRVFDYIAGVPIAPKISRVKNS